MTETESNSIETEEMHRLSARETLWVTTFFEPDPSNPSELDLTDEKIHNAAESLAEQWEYECSCGEEFDAFDEATEHIEAVAEALTD